MKCVICKQPFGKGEFEGISQFAAFGGLPSPCCSHCFNANDYSIINHLQLQARSILRRAKHGDDVFNVEGQKVEWTDDEANTWKDIEEIFAADTSLANAVKGLL